ncbi:hypothetical protein PF008_g27268 [Phytophthora fragariae]|uniref:Uncharacterized protein n=1 Tax=Phytophthora fragariae TaxID=53985 RepID=A0A6G0QF90_9STRA|nr:hypothetical protein PF008_g27268 [Phytophthora fragariae]
MLLLLQQVTQGLGQEPGLKHQRQALLRAELRRIWVVKRQTKPKSETSPLHLGRWRRDEVQEAKASRLVTQEQAEKDREDRQEERRLRLKETQTQLREDMFMQMLERGRTDEEALAIIDRILPL